MRSSTELKIKLHDKHGKQRWCGPAAISILTGESSDDAARMLRKIAGRRMIKGCPTWALLAGLERLGIYKTTLHPNPYRAHGARVSHTALAAWLRQERCVDATFLLVAGCHFAVVQGRRYSCGLTGNTVSFKDVPHRRARVTEVYELHQYNPLTSLNEIFLPAERPVDTQRVTRNEAKKIAAQYGIEIEKDEDKFYVSHPKLEEEADPNYGDHYRFDWGEVWHAVNDYVETIVALRAGGMAV